MSTIAERVAAGAAFLDEHDPEWWRADVKRAIDLDTLNLGVTDRCVLGQRCPVGTYFDSYEWMTRYDALAAMFSGIEASDSSDLDTWAIPLGFQAEDEDWEAEGGEFDALTAEWKRVITERRAAS